MVKVLKCRRKRGVMGLRPPPGGPMAAIRMMSTRLIWGGGLGREGGREGGRKGEREGTCRKEGEREGRKREGGMCIRDARFNAWVIG